MTQTALNTGLFERTHILLGDAGITTLKNSHVMIAGIGGVGSFVAESLARMGVGQLTLIDGDAAAPSNINRQLVALNSTVGQNKAEIMAARVRDINPDVVLNIMPEFVAADAFEALLLAKKPDYVVDCIDSLNCKLTLLEVAYKLEIPIACSMGAGGKTDPSQVRTGDIFDTTVCHLASHLRQKLKRRGVGRGIRTVYSLEVPLPPLPPEPTAQGRPRAVNGTVSYMPPIFGFTLAGLVVRDLVGITPPLKRKAVRKGDVPGDLSKGSVQKQG